MKFVYYQSDLNILHYIFTIKLSDKIIICTKILKRTNYMIIIYKKIIYYIVIRELDNKNTKIIKFFLFFFG